jgi:predicted amidohydrolase
MAEKYGEFLYNSQVLVGPDGAIVSVYRKRRLINLDIESGFKAGDYFVLDIIDNIKVATIICADLDSLRVKEDIHKYGAELVLLPVATEKLSINVLLPYQYTFTWILSANRIGNEEGINYDGMLSLTAPSGEWRIRVTGNEGYIFGVVRCR